MSGEGSRASRATAALASMLETALGCTVYEQWAGPETDLKSKLALGEIVGTVTCGGSVSQDFEGTEDYEEPAIGADSVLQRLGTEMLTMQVDLWAPSMDKRSDAAGALETLFDASGEDGVITATMSDGGFARFVRGSSHIMDNETTAGDREWRFSLDVNVEADIVAREYAPPFDILVKLRREDTQDPPPAPNTLGTTLTTDTFKVDPE